MPYAVEIFFDRKSEESIRDIWRKLHESEISSYMFTSGSRPHIALSIMDSIDLPEFGEKLKAFTEELYPIDLRFVSIGTFPGAEGVLFLSPTVTAELLELHKAFNSTFTSYKGEMLNYYLPGVWIPHCTIAMGLAVNQFSSALELVLRDFKPISAKIEEIGIVEFRPVKHHVSYKLLKRGVSK